MRTCVAGLVLAAMAGCTLGTGARVEQPILLDYARSEIVRTRDVSRYRCSEGLLVVERLSSSQRRITCGAVAVPALLR